VFVVSVAPPGIFERCGPRDWIRPSYALGQNHGHRPRAQAIPGTRARATVADCQAAVSGCDIDTHARRPGATSSRTNSRSTRNTRSVSFAGFVQEVRLEAVTDVELQLERGRGSCCGLIHRLQAPIYCAGLDPSGISERVFRQQVPATITETATSVPAKFTRSLLWPRGAS